MAAAREGEPAWTAWSASGLIGLAAACGLRPAELYRLRCADIDLRAGRVAIMESKRAQQPSAAPAPIGRRRPGRPLEAPSRCPHPGP